MNPLQNALELEVKKAGMTFMYGGKVNGAMLIVAIRNITGSATAPNIIHARTVSQCMAIA